MKIRPIQMPENIKENRKHLTIPAHTRRQTGTLNCFFSYHRPGQGPVYFHILMGKSGVMIVRLKPEAFSSSFGKDMERMMREMKPNKK